MFPIPLSRPLTFVDLETTGKVPATARIVEIAIYQIKSQTELAKLLAEETGDAADAADSWVCRVNPGIPIPPDATAIHGITDDDVKDAEAFAGLAPLLFTTLADCDFGGYNVRFDLDVLKQEFARVGLSFQTDDAYVIDGLRLWQVIEPRTLSDFIERFLGRRHEGAHGALADITGTAEGCAAAIVHHFGDVPDMKTLHDLQFPRAPGAVDKAGKLVLNAAGHLVLTFGKHVDTRWRDIPPGYRTWLLTKADLPGDTLKYLPPPPEQQ